MKIQPAPSFFGFGRSVARGAETGDETSIRLEKVGATLIFFLLFIFVLAVAALAVGATLDRSVSRGILVASIALTAFVSHRLFREAGLIFWIVTATVAIFSAVAAAAIYDTSIDGQHYHFQAIYAFSHGWNPLWTTEAPPSIGDPASLWVSHYPDAAWLIEATLLSAGLPLEATKGINLIALISSGFILWGTLRSFGIRRWPGAMLIAAAMLNPVSLSELFTRMNDGLFACCILIFVASASRWVLRDDRNSFLVAAAAMLLGINLKFSAIPIFAVLSATAVVGAYLVRGPRAGVDSALRLLATGLVGVVLLGANPYALNLMHFGHPFYPVMGNGSVDIMATNTPQVIEPLSGPYRFLFSLFSETHAGYGPAPHLKWPFSMSLDEIRAAGGVDIRIAGFGPLFSGALLLALILLLIALFRGNLSPESLVIFFVTVGVCASVLIIPQNWWARYVPQFWLVPLLISAALLATGSPWFKVGAMTVATIMLLNSVLAGGVATYLAAKRSAAVSNQLAELKRQSQPVCVSAEYAQSRIAIFKASGIDVRNLSGPPASWCPAPIQFAGYGPDRVGGVICPCN